MDFTGRGAILSARDLQALYTWSDQGLPTELIFRAIRTCARDNDTVPRDLWACRWHVEREAKACGIDISNHKKRRPDAPQTEHHNAKPTPSGAAENSYLIDTLNRIEQAGRTTQHASIKDLYRDLWKRVRDTPDDALIDELFALSDELTDLFWAQLSDTEQKEIDARISAGLTKANMSPDALQWHVKSQREAVLKADYGLINLLEGLEL